MTKRVENKFVVSLKNNKTGEKTDLIVTANNVDDATRSLCGNIIGYDCEYEWLGSAPLYEPTGRRGT